MIIERKLNSDLDPIRFERPSSKAYWYSKRWNRELPRGVHLRVHMLPSMNRTLDPHVIERSSRVILEKLCEHKGKTAVNVLAHKTHRRQLGGFIVYAEDHTCRRTSYAKVRKQSELVVRLDNTGLTAKQVLRDLKAMLEEQDEPDFRHSPTEYAYNTAQQIIENSYTHYLGSAPIPTIAPDGGGGIIAEWKSGPRIVRLIVSASQDGKSYVYSREATRSQIDHLASGLTLSQQLCSIFPD